MNLKMQFILHLNIYESFIFRLFFFLDIHLTLFSFNMFQNKISKNVNQKCHVLYNQKQN